MKVSAKRRAIFRPSRQNGAPVCAPHPSHTQFRVSAKFITRDFLLPPKITPRWYIIFRYRKIQGPEFGPGTRSKEGLGPPLSSNASHCHVNTKFQSTDLVQMKNMNFRVTIFRTYCKSCKYQEFSKRFTSFRLAIPGKVLGPSSRKF